MAHRAKHLRRNWTPQREGLAVSPDRHGPAATPVTTGLARALKAIDRNHRVLPVVAFLRRA